MDNESNPEPNDGAKTRDLLRQKALLRHAPPGAGAALPALEATLVSISEEVTAEAVERRERAANAQ